MGILQITTDVAGQINVNPRRVKIISSDNLATVTAAGYLNPASLEGYSIYNTDIIDMWYGATGTPISVSIPGTYGEFLCSITNGIITLNLIDNNLVAPVVLTYTNTSPTPGTIRTFTAQMDSTAVTETSGNIVAVRGVVNMIGSSTSAFIYGVQGKIVATGTLASGQFEAAVFGQLDISAATINGGQLAPIWGDYGTTSGTLTSQVNLYGIAMTNTTAAVLAGQLYLYGGANQLMLLNTNAGLSGTTYFLAAGTSSGSAGYTSGCNATEVLKISVNGTQYYLPLFAQNS